MDLDVPRSPLLFQDRPVRRFRSRDSTRACGNTSILRRPTPTCGPGTEGFGQDRWRRTGSTLIPSGRHESRARERSVSRISNGTFLRGRRVCWGRTRPRRVGVASGRRTLAANPDPTSVRPRPLIGKDRPSSLGSSPGPGRSGSVRIFQCGPKV